MLSKVAFALLSSMMMTPAASSSVTPHKDNSKSNAQHGFQNEYYSPKQRNTQQQEEDDRYEILPSNIILARLQSLAAKYPTFSTLTTTQEWFNLPRAGNSNDCVYDTTYPSSNGDGCNNYVLILQDKEAYPDDADVKLSGDQELYLSQEGGWWKDESLYDAQDGEGKSGWKYVPDVFLSGSVHGDERVGPTSLVEMSELLLESAYCESLPRMKYQPKMMESAIEGIAEEEEEEDGSRGSSDEEAAPNDQIMKWKEELTTAQTCRQYLATKGVTPPLRKWLARLVSTRRTIVIPTANALGYSRSQRAEDGIDPNRDFPFDIPPSQDDQCMQTIAGRSINELFRSHLFPIGLTFHGGMEVIGYEWGAPTYLNKVAPDEVAQNTIASAYSRYANGFPNHQAYDYGTMNDKVYYVRGGMEDWAFAGSWDPDRVVECRPKTFGGDYPPEKTRYNNSTLRAFNMLIETSDIKSPPRDSLGKRSQPLISSDGNENGHIARNMRLALLAMDVVEPYVSIQGVEDLQLEDDDVVPGVNLRRYNEGSHFENSRMVWVPPNRKNFRITWTVGGSFDIDFTEIVYGPWDALPQYLVGQRDGFYPSMEMIESVASHEFNTILPSNIDKTHQGRSNWHEEGPFPASSNNDILGPFFETMIDVSKYPPGMKLAIFAKAKVDKAWLNVSPNVGPPGHRPLSHIVNARTNPSYFASNAGKVIRGRKDSWWYSAPITLVMGTDGEGAWMKSEAMSNNAPLSVFDGKVRAVHINSRAGSVPSLMKMMIRESFRESLGNNFFGNRDVPLSSSGSSMPWILGALSLLLGVFGLMVVLRRRKMYAHRRRLEQVADDDDGFSVEISDAGYHDDVNTSLESIRID